MALIMGTISVPGNATVASFIIPPGYFNMTVYQPSQAQRVFVGTSSSVNSTNGMAITPTPITSEGAVGTGGPTTFFATTGNATAATFCYLLSSTN